VECDGCVGGSATHWFVCFGEATLEKYDCGCKDEGTISDRTNNGKCVR